MIVVETDGLTPCLRDNWTGELVQTEVVRIRRRSFLSKCSESTMWYVDWASLLGDNEVYALVIRGTVDIQGLVAVRPDGDAGALYIAWACANPLSSGATAERKRYDGIGGHLFAIAARRAFELGFDGEMYGFAANRRLVEHYVETFGAMHVGILHPYQIIIDGETSRELMEVYTYEWTDDEI